MCFLENLNKGIRHFVLGWTGGSFYVLCGFIGETLKHSCFELLVVLQKADAK